MRSLRGRSSQSLTRESKSRAGGIARARSAFDEVYRQLYSHAVAYAAKYADEASVEELVQDAFLRLWKSCYADGDVPVGSPRPLMYKILRDRLQDHRRRALLRPTDASLDAMLDAGEDFEDEPARLVADGQLLKTRVNYLVNAMPSRMQQAFRLSQVHGDLGKVAEAMNVSRETARWQLWEAKRRLREALTKDGYIIGARGYGAREDQ